MICPLLTYVDMHTAMTELAEVFGLQIVWLSDDVAEIRWNGGVAVAQTDRPEDLHGSHICHGWTYIRVSDPDAHHSSVIDHGGRVLNEPHAGRGDLQRGFSARDREGNVWTFATHEFGGERKLC